MSRRHAWIAVGGTLAVTAALVVWNQIEVHLDRQARAELFLKRHPPVPAPPEVTRMRQALYDMLQPVALTNCQLQRFGEAHDGGYLMCANLLGGAAAGYSYGIGGYDKWGCDISTTLDVTVHQYDCFDPRRPACSAGNTVFHDECVSERRETIDGRPFDTIANQLAANGDGARRLVVKIDVEGAEWNSLLSTPDDVLQRIDQLAIEFHWLENDSFRWVGEETYLRLVERLRQSFEVAHIHFNNASCVGDLAPFPSWAFEVLFVSKRLAVVDPSRTPRRPNPLDARNNTAYDDCQPAPSG
jgi:hypothetical protein